MQRENLNNPSTKSRIISHTIPMKSAYDLARSSMQSDVSSRIREILTRNSI